MLHNDIVPVSVVIPCFRCATTIGRAVNSIVRQTQKPIEVILVDDASGDNTIGLLREIEQQYSGWIKVIALTENQGAASARNAGWAMATQPYIAFLDADDSWHPEKLCIQYEFMRNNPDVTLCAHRCIWLRDKETPPVLQKDLKTRRISAGSLLFKCAFSTPTVMLKCDIAFRFQEGKRCSEDFLLWQQIAFAGFQVMCIDSPLAYLHKPLYGGGGLSAQMWEMEKGELNNFVVLYNAGSINLFFYIMGSFFSLAKFIKRLFSIRLKILANLSTHRGDIV